MKAEAEETYTRLQDAQRDRDRYLEELRIAEVKLDRANSQILNSVAARKQETTPVKVNGEAKTEPGQDESGVKKEDTPTVVSGLSWLIGANLPLIYLFVNAFLN